MPLRSVDSSGSRQNLLILRSPSRQTAFRMVLKRPHGSASDN